MKKLFFALRYNDSKWDNWAFVITPAITIRHGGYMSEINISWLLWVFEMVYYYDVPE
jgi:hypothetical protein